MSPSVRRSLSQTNKGRVLAERINARTEHTKPSDSRDRFLKRVWKNDQKKKEAREKVPGFSRSARPAEALTVQPGRRGRAGGAFAFRGTAGVGK